MVSVLHILGRGHSLNKVREGGSDTNVVIKSGKAVKMLPREDINLILDAQERTRYLILMALELTNEKIVIYSRMDKNLKMGPLKDKKIEKRDLERTKKLEKWNLKSVGSPQSSSLRGDSPPGLHKAICQPLDYMGSTNA